MMDRRELSALLAAAAASTMLPRPLRALAAAPAPAVSSAAARLYSRALVLDANSGPPYEDGKLPLSPAAIQLVRESGVDVVKLSLGGIDSGFDETVGEIAYLQRMIEVHPDVFLQVRVPGDLARPKAERKLGIILSFESVEMLGGEVARLEVFRNLGVRVMQLSYNKQSAFAAGVMAPEAGGLTEAGRQAVRRMNELGITIDVSHANPQTTSDVLALSAQPVVMTHAGSAVVHPHPRNKTDAQLRAVADKGGVIGIFDLPYLTASPRQPTADDYLAHLEHVLQVAGEDHVGLGSDVSLAPFDTSPQGMEGFRKDVERRQQAGLSAPEEDRPPYVEGMNTPRRLEVVADRLLRRGHGEAVVEKILGANFARVFTANWAS